MCSLLLFIHDHTPSFYQPSRSCAHAHVVCQYSGMGTRRPAPGNVRGPSVPFEGQSTHSSDFRATGGKPASPFVPKLLFQQQPEDRYEPPFHFPLPSLTHSFINDCYFVVTL
jgi:hypothetical protein